MRACVGQLDMQDQSDIESKQPRVLIGGGGRGQLESKLPGVLIGGIGRGPLESVLASEQV